jgi:hypothetical protein
VLRIDHVAYAVSDLDDAAERFRRDLGLDSRPGGRHPRWGTANRIIPLVNDYIELIGGVEESASHTWVGRAVLERARDGGGWLAICAAADDLDAIARRLQLEISGGTRERPDGSVLRWRSAGLEDPRREPSMPFFISWEGREDDHPGRLRAGHGVQVNGIARVDVEGDAEALDSWLGGAELPIRVEAGVGGIRAVTLATHDGELVIG